MGDQTPEVENSPFSASDAETEGTETESKGKSKTKLGFSPQSSPHMTPSSGEEDVGSEPRSNLSDPGRKKKETKKKLQKKTPDGDMQGGSTSPTQRKKRLTVEDLGNEDEFTKNKKKAHSRSARAGLSFPVSLTQQVVKNVSGLQAGMTTSVYLAAAVETILAEILSTASNICKQAKHKTITPRHIALAIQGDEDMKQLIKATIPGAGVPERIHPNLMKQAAPKPRMGVRKDLRTKGMSSMSSVESPYRSVSPARSSASMSPAR